MELCPGTISAFICYDPPKQAVTHGAPCVMCCDACGRLVSAGWPAAVTSQLGQGPGPLAFTWASVVQALPDLGAGTNGGPCVMCFVACGKLMSAGWSAAVSSQLGQGPGPLAFTGAWVVLALLDLGMSLNCLGPCHRAVVG